MREAQAVKIVMNSDAAYTESISDNPRTPVEYRRVLPSEFVRLLTDDWSVEHRHAYPHGEIIFLTRNVER